MTDLHEILQTIKTLNTDLRAEVVVAGLQEDGLSPNQVSVRCSGTFKRAYRKDIIKAKLQEESSFNEAIYLELSRDGLYDLLPEGLFHHSLKGSNQQVSRMVAEHKRFKQEEDEARRFFSPFENEFFHQKTGIEKKEKQFLRSVTVEKNKLFQRLWQLPEHFPETCGKKLLEFLPLAGKITGKPEAMANALQAILQESVHIVVNHFHETFHSEQHPEEDSTLGLNSTLGASYIEVLPCFEFHIGPLKNHSILDFLPEHPLHLVLETFMRYFVPLEAEIKTIFIPDISSEKQTEPKVLGYNFAL